MRLTLAPLQGVTEFPFRNTWLKYFSGLDEAFSPFIPCITGDRIKPVHVFDILPGNNDPALPLVPQVLCNRSGPLLALAHAVSSMGYGRMNWNMGCPSATVVKKKRGCGLMPHPAMVQQILMEVMPMLPVELSVKVRLGLHGNDELWKMLDVLNKFGIEKVILHPRLGIQMYGGDPDLVAFGRALALSGHPVVYNGDINTPEFFRELMQMFPGVEEWMLGRGVLKNPFLPGVLKGKPFPKEVEAREALITFHDTLMEGYLAQGYSEKRVTVKMKEYWNYFSHWFADREDVWYALSHRESFYDLRVEVDEAFRGPLNPGITGG